MKILKKIAFFLLMSIGMYMILLFSSSATGLKKGMDSYFEFVTKPVLEMVHSTKDFNFLTTMTAAGESHQIHYALESDIEKAKRQAKKGKKGNKGKKSIGVRSGFIDYNTWSKFTLPFFFLICIYLFSPVNWKSKLMWFVPVLLTLHFWVWFDLNMYLVTAMQKKNFAMATEKGSLLDSFSKAYVKNFPAFMDVTILIAGMIWMLWLVFFTDIMDRATKLISKELSK